MIKAKAVLNPKILFIFTFVIVTQSQAVNLCLVTEVSDVTKKIKNCGTKQACDSNKPAGWELYWSDDFNTNGRPDGTKWKFETGGDGFGNDEDQFYTDRPTNSWVEDGKLIIRAKKEKFQKRDYTSAKLRSTESFTYGRFVFRAKLPKGKGTWAAGWLLADKQVYGSQLWPHNGEIDVLEAVGHEGNFNNASTHTEAHNFQKGNGHTKKIGVPGGDDEFHDYAVEWLPQSIDFFVDNIKYLSIPKKKKDNWRVWPFKQDFHIILNLAVGGFWAREEGIDDSAFPANFEIESVKVYRPNLSKCK